MYIVLLILLLIALIVLEGYCIYELSGGKIFKSIFHPIQSAKEAAREYIENK